jgi:carboxyl-terminal processing protease
MKKIWMAGVGGAVAGAVVSTQFAAPILAQEAESERTVYEQLDLFGDIFERVRSSYVEEVEDKELIESAINGMLTHLDPHSSYLPPDDFDDMRVQTRGEFGGLGIEVTQENGFVKVVSPIEGTPADRAGVQPGDLITQVDGESVMGLNLNEAVDLMRGPVGSEITITITREGTADPFDVKLTRETITISPVRARLEDGVVVVRLTTFNEQTYPELEQQLKERVEEAGGMEKVTGIVLDLRNNPGGLLNQAISVTDAFLESGEVVSTRGRDPADSERYNATPGDLAEGKPMAVVINGGSASASEIVAGALKDHHRAVVIGTQSFGKGSVQTIMPVQGEGAIRLTTARYYTPSGRSIQALGVTPDITVEQAKLEKVAQAPTRKEADLRGALSNDTVAKPPAGAAPGAPAPVTTKSDAAPGSAEDYQLQRAVDLLVGTSLFRQLPGQTPGQASPSPMVTKTSG